MEIYVNDTNRTVELTVPASPVSNTLTVEIFDNNGVLVHTVNTVNVTSTGLSFTFPLHLSTADGDYSVHWKFDYLEDGHTYVYQTDAAVNVVTPILPLSVIAGLLGEGLNSEQNVATAEAAVRTIIQAHTGQKFGYSKGKTLRVEGHGETALRLPERLINLTGIGTLTANLDPLAAIIVSDGWYLKKSWANEISEVANNSVYWSDYRDSVAFDNNIYSDPDGDGQPPIVGPLGTRPGGVISAPGVSSGPTRWVDDYSFTITGDWGYKSVPVAVQEAAKLLINDYACSEAAYRDRYLETIKASDWELDFNSRAWDSTGNVRADQLLSEYVLLDWAAI